MMSTSNKIPFSQVVAALLDTSKPFSPTLLHRLSDLEDKELRKLRDAWSRIDPTRRLGLLQDLEEFGDNDTLVDFDAVAMIGLDDSEGRIRAQAAGMLWEYEAPALARKFLKMVENDPFPEARAKAAAALGKFVYIGELDELEPALRSEIENKLIGVVGGKDEEPVRQKALEALGFSSRPEVKQQIRDAYDSRKTAWQVSALIAMGRSYDQEWEPDVKRELSSADGKLQIEAVRAAGQLGLGSTRRILLDMLEDEATDSEILAEVIWALSEIGGEEVRETLEKMADETDDEELGDVLAEALDNLDLNEDLEQMKLFDIDLIEEASSARVVDLSAEDENQLTEDENNETGTSGDQLPPKTTRKRHKK